MVKEKMKGRLGSDVHFVCALLTQFRDRGAVHVPLLIYINGRMGQISLPL